MIGNGFKRFIRKQERGNLPDSLYIGCDGGPAFWLKSTIVLGESVEGWNKPRLCVYAPRKMVKWVAHVLRVGVGGKRAKTYRGWMSCYSHRVPSWFLDELGEGDTYTETEVALAKALKKNVLPKWYPEEFS